MPCTHVAWSISLLDFSVISHRILHSSLLLNSISVFSTFCHHLRVQCALTHRSLALAPAPALLLIMMNYQYPPPHPMSIEPAQHLHLAPPLPPHSAAPPQKQPASLPPPPSSSLSSYSHRPLRPSYDIFNQPQQEMPESAPPPPTYNYPPPLVSTPTPRAYLPDNAYASLRRGENGYHLPQVNHGSRKRSSLDQQLHGGSTGLDPNSNNHYPSGATPGGSRKGE
ncbi:hypothetical protein BDW59DRAFT_139071 [Aspergillus cavernicola]|uniref:Uncharacterized protein n=1 Tax=Aspergillus cavernicola TaxID=176166 RepID=A0ABR4IZ32_9EURO